MQSSITFEKACCEISQSILAREKLTVKTARDEIMRICAKYSLSQIPRNDEILATVNGENYKSLQKILIRKPVKTASGVAVIALMAKPYACRTVDAHTVLEESSTIVPIVILETSHPQLVQ